MAAEDVRVGQVWRTSNEKQPSRLLVLARKTDYEGCCWAQVVRHSNRSVYPDGYVSVWGVGPESGPFVERESLSVPLPLAAVDRRGQMRVLVGGMIVLVVGFPGDPTGTGYALHPARVISALNKREQWRPCFNVVWLAESAFVGSRRLRRSRAS